MATKKGQTKKKAAIRKPTKIKPIPLSTRKMC